MFPSQAPKSAQKKPLEQWFITCWRHFKCFYY